MESFYRHKQNSWVCHPLINLDLTEKNKPKSEKKAAEPTQPPVAVTAFPKMGRTNNKSFEYIPADSEKTQVVRLRRRRGKIIQDCEIYIGRKIQMGGWHLRGSIWQNPFHLNGERGRKAVLEKYRRYVESNESLMNELHTLKGKRLGCWCAPKRCHGDVLVELLQKQESGWNEFKTEMFFVQLKTNEKSDAKTKFHKPFRKAKRSKSSKTPPLDSGHLFLALNNEVICCAPAEFCSVHSL